MKLKFHILCIVVLFLGACNSRYVTITKKKHSKGYYTDLHLKNPKATSKCNTKETHPQLLALNDVPSEQDSKNINSTTLPIEKLNTAATNVSVKSNNTNSLKHGKIISKIQTFVHNKPLKIAKNALKNSGGIASLNGSGGQMEIIGVIGFTLWCLAAILSSFIPFMGIFNLVGIILCIVSLNKHKREMGSYSGDIFPLITLWVETVILLLAALFFLIFGVLVMAIDLSGFGTLFGALFIVAALICGLLGGLLLNFLLKYRKAKREGSGR